MSMLRVCKRGLDWIKLTLLFTVGLFPYGAESGLHERRLLNDLLVNYNKLERPVVNESDAVVLTFGLTLQQIIDVDEKNQLLTANVWLNLEWTDVNLRWNESEYGNVKDIRIPPSTIWKPDILMYNSASEAFDGTYPTNVVVTSNGGCSYIPPGIFKSTCKIDITWFPFDDQNCDMKFGSWTYNGFNLDLNLKSDTGGDTSTYILNGEWDLIGVPAKRNEVIYECCPEPYLDITFIIQIRRRTLYYFFNLIVPCVLIASMAVLGFTLPPDSGEKLSLGITVLLSLTVFQSIVTETLPQVSDAIPALGTYFNCIMFMVASSVVTTIMILNYHHRLADTHEMPDWVRVLFLQWIPWLLRMSRPGEKITRKTIMMQNKMKELDLKEKSSKSLLANVLDMDDDFRPSSTLPHSHVHPHHPSHAHPQQNNGGFIRQMSVDREPWPRVSGNLPPQQEEVPSTFPPGAHRELSLILKEIKIITDKIRDDEEAAAIENDWKFAAMVLDRLCLIVFTLFTIVATVAVLAAAPHVIVT
ncbi:neuronal acetylcholine receptor subunit alpha-7 isoform X2 [Eurytemora carolleeae]|uniref:neuronal acetylcholine receptor subunit alpha-7 isoform X2 n=1 Tax=Eurytemora carolleeae TaxID=1294199 RepID=UPI000C79096C|nr:neuronal acetylcholine receptor subunit alpha-7 isoform X2 [Eurytemora carolleeae]|eukprot:XP_023339135.1 neuronal acetylcholine receptor subunit alpha-7-like isoform X2 [Eurytemora affinis]